MNILITGGFGYLGSRIATYLYDKGYKIFIGSRRYRKTPKWLPDSKVREINIKPPVLLIKQLLI